MEEDRRQFEVIRGMEREVLRLQHKLHQVDGANIENEETMEVVKKLESLLMTPEILKKSKVGRTVNELRRRIPNGDKYLPLQQRLKRLLRKWIEVATPGSSGKTSPTPSSVSQPSSGAKQTALLHAQEARASDCGAAAANTVQQGQQEPPKKRRRTDPLPPTTATKLDSSTSLANPKLHALSSPARAVVSIAQLCASTADKKPGPPQPSPGHLHVFFTPTVLSIAQLRASSDKKPTKAEGLQPAKSTDGESPPALGSTDVPELYSLQDLCMAALKKDLDAVVRSAKCPLMPLPVMDLVLCGMDKAQLKKLHKLHGEDITSGLQQTMRAQCLLDFNYEAKELEKQHAAGKVASELITTDDQLDWAKFFVRQKREKARKLKAFGAKMDKLCEQEEKQRASQIIQRATPQACKIKPIKRPGSTMANLAKSKGGLKAVRELARKRSESFKRKLATGKTNTEYIQQGSRLTYRQKPAPSGKPLAGTPSTELYSSLNERQTVKPSIEPPSP
eukprot:g82401.t1